MRRALQESRGTNADKVSDDQGEALGSGEEKRALVKHLGADAAMDYTQSGWAEKVKAATGGRGVDVFLDATGALDGEGFDALANGARWMIFGFVSRVLTLKGFSLYTALERIPQALPQLVEWAASGRLQIESGSRFPLAQAKEAQQAIAARKTMGKVVLEP